MSNLGFTLTVLTALGCGLIGGALFAFSSFVMKGLARLPPAQGVAAMQAINVAAVTFAFMLALFGTALGCMALVVVAVFAWDEPSAVYQLAGSVLYLVGVILLTIAYHVPRNDALAKLEPTSGEAAEQWARYLADWTRWNHVRTAAALASAALLVCAVRVG